MKSWFLPLLAAVCIYYTTGFDLTNTLENVSHDFAGTLDHLSKEGHTVSSHLLEQGLLGANTLLHGGLNNVLNSVYKTYDRRSLEDLSGTIRTNVENMLEDKIPGFHSIFELALTRFHQIATKVNDSNFIHQPVGSVEDELDRIVSGHQRLSDALVSHINIDMKDMMAHSQLHNYDEVRRLADDFEKFLKPHLLALKDAVTTVGGSLKSSMSNILSTIHSIESTRNRGEDTTTLVHKLETVIQQNSEKLRLMGNKVLTSLTDRVIDVIVNNAK